SGFIPIVILAVNYDPIERGYVSSLSRPGGNITGVFYRQPELAVKQLELLTQAFPNATRLGTPSCLPRARGSNESPRADVAPRRRGCRVAAGGARADEADAAQRRADGICRGRSGSTSLDQNPPARSQGTRLDRWQHRPLRLSLGQRQPRAYGL